MLKSWNAANARQVWNGWRKLYGKPESSLWGLLNLCVNECLIYFFDGNIMLAILRLAASYLRWMRVFLSIYFNILFKVISNCYVYQNGRKLYNNLNINSTATLHCNREPKSLWLPASSISINNVCLLQVVIRRCNHKLPKKIFPRYSSSKFHFGNLP